MPFPRLFAAPGEDRSAIEPWHPQIRAVLEQAKAGNVQAMRAMANLYLEGREYPQDLALGMAWLSKAANAGDTEAMNLLGTLLLNGRAGKTDPAAALQWFHAAADKGDGSGLLNLGICYAT